MIRIHIRAEAPTRCELPKQLKAALTLVRADVDNTTHGNPEDGHYWTSTDENEKEQP